MDDVAEILSGNYGIRQHCKSTPMAASKPSKITTFATFTGGISNSGTPFSLTEEKIPLSSSKNDCLLESLGFRLTEIEGLGFEELVKGGDAPVDPFLFFEKDLSYLHQFSGETKVISPANNVAGTGSDSFDIFEDFGRSNSSLLSERNVNAGKIRTCGAFENPSYVQKPPMGDFLDSNPNSCAPKPPTLENFDFFSMYDTALNEKKERAFREERKEENRSYNGIESFFSGIGLGGKWPPTQMEATPENTIGGAQRIPSASNISINESSFMKNMIGDLSKSEDIEGDNEYRRQARYEREQKKSARAAKALAEKNNHDFALQREQNEREMIAEELDIEVKQWAAGREGNLRALLSTLQDVLWPECGWQPVSLANLMTSSAVKKVYGKAALCIHPDKVQQKGSNIRQKYVAEKVFYILTEALNKFSSEELT